MKNEYTNQNHFFILSKGLNAGKPMHQPCPNCFVLFAKCETEKQQLFWLCFGLWQGNFFRPFLTGSVISFIRIDDLKKVMSEALQKVELNPSAFEKSIEILNKLNKHQENIHQQLTLIKEAKKALMYKIMR
jgi:hypothetical protein